MNPILKGLRTAVAAVAVGAMVQSVGSIALAPLADASNTQLAATTAVNIRAAASAGSARVGILYRGEKVQAISSGNGWTAVSHKGRTAYVASAYLSTSSTLVGTPSASSPAGDVYTIANLNLRVGPSLSDAVATVATKGAKLRRTGTISGTYSQVQFNDRTLWAASSYLCTTITGWPAYRLSRTKENTCRTSPFPRPASRRSARSARRPTSPPSSPPPAARCRPPAA